MTSTYRSPSTKELSRWNWSLRTKVVFVLDGFNVEMHSPMLQGMRKELLHHPNHRSKYLWLRLPLLQTSRAAWTAWRRYSGVLLELGYPLEVHTWRECTWIIPEKVKRQDIDAGSKLQMVCRGKFTIVLPFFYNYGFLNEVLPATVPYKNHYIIMG